MAKVHGIAGEWARVRGTVLGLWPLFLGVFASGFALAFVRNVWGAAAFVLALIYCGWTLHKGLRHVERFFKGARGEEHVSELLTHLPDAYHVFNDFLASGSHVDHVVVGPAGVFSIETKCWNGKVTLEEGHILINGRLPDHSPLRQTLKEAADVRAELAKKGWTGQVTPILAFASNTFEAQIAELQGVVILNANSLTNSFNTERIVLAPAEIDRLIALMENNS